jgi:hypothetical protein
MIHLYGERSFLTGTYPPITRAMSPRVSRVTPL